MARLVCCCLPILLLFLSVPATAQRYTLEFVPGSSAGEHLELIQHQIDTKKKLEQIGRFLTQFPNHPAAGFLLEWLQSYHLRAEQPDLSLAAGENLLSLYPDDFDAMLQCQKAAGLKKDAALQRIWDERALRLAERIATMTPPPKLDPKTWAQSVDIAKAMLAQREYNDYTAAYESSLPREKAHLLEEFVKKYPKSQYEPQVWPQLMSAYRSLGESSRAISAAETQLSRVPNDPDALLLIAQILLERRTDLPRVMANANRVLMTVSNLPKPEVFTAEAWEKRKISYIGSAHVLIGNVYVNQNNFAMADKSLRVALPYMTGNEQTEAAILFYLGWANYHLENYKEAAAFFRQCSALAGAGAFGEQATKNLAALKNERRLVE